MARDLGAASSLAEVAGGRDGRGAAGSGLACPRRGGALPNLGKRRRRRWKSLHRDEEEEEKPTRKIPANCRMGAVEDAGENGGRGVWFMGHPNFGA